MQQTQLYNWQAKLLHWLCAAIVFGLFAVGVWMVDLNYYSSWYKTAPDLHRSFGVLLALLLLWRVVNRLINGVPAAVSGPPNWQVKIAHVVHLTLYTLMFSLIFSGYLISTADGRSVEVFYLLNIPATLTGKEQQAELAGFLHEWLAYGLIALVALHAAAALKHHILDKDNTLTRILWSNGDKQ